MPEISTEATIGLLMEVAVGILDHLHVRDGLIIWGLFGVGFLLLSHAVIRSRWVKNEPLPKLRIKKRVWVMISVIAAAAIFGFWIVKRTRTMESGPEKSTDKLSAQSAPSPTLESTDTAKIRTDAAGLLHNVYISNRAWWDEINNESRNIQNHAGSEVVAQIRIHQANDKFNKSYQETYRRDISNTRQVLEGHIQHLPQANPNSIEFLYREMPPNWPASPQLVEDQLCYTRLLLNELEREHKMELTGGELSLNCDRIMPPPRP